MYVFIFFIEKLLKDIRNLLSFMIFHYSFKGTFASYVNQISYWNYPIMFEIAKYTLYRINNLRIENSISTFHKPKWRSLKSITTSSQLDSHSQVNPM